MADEPDDPVSIRPSRLDATMEGTVDGLADLETRLMSLDGSQAVMSRRMGRPQARIVRRLDLVDMTH